MQRIADAGKSKNASTEQAELIREELNAHADDMRSTVRELESLVQGGAATAIARPAPRRDSERVVASTSA